MITEYRRPLTLDEALALASRPDTFVLAGGTFVNGDSGRSGICAVDLQALELTGIESTDGTIRIGAMTLLQDIADSETVPEALRLLAGREAPNTIRNAATVGGTIGALDPDSELLAGLLAFDAVTTIATSSATTDYSLDHVIRNPHLLNGSILTSIALPATGVAVTERTGRTPADRPIVSAVAFRSADGDIRLALTGIAATPVVVESDRLNDLAPPSDFRGSAEYRRHLASVLARRVLAAVAEDVGP